MRIAIVSDVHGNLPALEAVVADLAKAPPDLVVHGGDLALGGLRPAECVALIRELGWPGVVGNTDAVLWSTAEVPAQFPDHIKVSIEESAAATRKLMPAEQIDWLRSLPSTWRQGSQVALVHAVPGDIWSVVPKTAADELLETTFGPLDASVAVYCHIHLPFVRALNGLTVANSGSVGMPFDGDRRASYLIVEDGTPEIHRVEYDVDSEAAALLASGYPDAEARAWGLKSGRAPGEHARP